jgi:hypothetical protein
MTTVSSSITRQGNQGQLDAAPKRDLENEFGTSNEDEAIAKILEGGSVVETQVSPGTACSYNHSAEYEPDADAFLSELRTQRNQEHFPGWHRRPLNILSMISAQYE